MSAKLCTPKVAKSFPRRKYASPRGNASSNGQSSVDPISATNANRSAMVNGFSRGLKIAQKSEFPYNVGVYT